MSSKRGPFCGHTEQFDSEEIECERSVGSPDEECIFHRPLSEKVGSDVLEVFAEELDEAPDSRPIVGEEDPPCFAGATFGGVELEDTQLAAECSFRIDFRGVTAKDFDLTSSEIVRTLDLSESRVEGDMVFEKAMFDSEFVCDEVHVEGTVDLSGAEFDRPISLSGMEIDGDLLLAGATLNAGLNCESADIAGDLVLDGAEIGDDARFEDTTIFGDVSSEKTRIDGSLDLTGVEIAEVGSLDEVIDFGGVDISGPVTLDGAKLHDSIEFENAHLVDTLSMDGTEVRGDVVLDESNAETIEVMGDGQIRGSLTIDGSLVEELSLDTITLQSITLDRTVVERELYFDRVDLGDLTIRGCTVERQTELSQSSISGRILVDGTRFGSDVLFDTINVQGGTLLTDSRYENGLEISDGEYSGDLKLKESTFREKTTIKDLLAESIDLRYSTFDDEFRAEDLLLRGGPLSASEADFLGNCTLDNVRTITRIEADEAQFDRGLTVQDSRAPVGVSLRGADVSGPLALSEVETPQAEGIEVDLGGAEVESGTLERAKDHLYRTNLTLATLGDVSFVNNGGNTYEHLLFDRTAFVDFEFSDYQPELRTESWRLHNDRADAVVPTVTQSSPSNNRILKIFWYVITPILATYYTWNMGVQITESECGTGSKSEEDGDNNVPLPDAGPALGDQQTFEPPATRSDVENLQTTYLKAKNGANRVGAKRIASEFFLQEMHYRQILHVIDSQKSPVFGRIRWLKNTTLRITAGYGERPLRVVGGAILTILVFGFGYWLIDPAEMNGLNGAMATSAGSFVTLIFNTTPQFGSSTMQLLAMMEGFLGAIFAALLVFTLTRAVHR